MAIEGDSPVDFGSFCPRDKAAGVPSSADDTVIAPDMIRFAIQKID
jgi:hypothetical protein